MQTQQKKETGLYLQPNAIPVAKAESSYLSVVLFLITITHHDNERKKHENTIVDICFDKLKFLRTSDKSPFDRH